MTVKRVKGFPNGTTSVVDVLPYTVMPSSSASFNIVNEHQVAIFIEDLRGHIVEINLDVESLLEINKAMKAQVSIAQSPIQVRSRSIMIGKNTVTYNKEVSPYIDASKFVGDYDAIYDNAMRTGLYWDLGPCLLMLNGDFIVLLSTDQTGNNNEDITLVYRSTIISLLVNMQSHHKFSPLELNMLKFNLAQSFLMQDPTVVHFNESVILNHEGQIYASRVEVVEFLLSNSKYGNKQNLKPNDVLFELGLPANNYNQYRSVKIYKLGNLESRNLETFIEFEPLLGTSGDELIMYTDGSVYLSADYGANTKLNYAYLDRPHNMTSVGVGTPPSLLKDTQKDTITKAEANTPSRRSRIFS